jgi:group II intron reverse transcriptase/maturase
VAREKPGTALTSLSHHIDLEWLREAWRLTRKDGAAGVDGVTAQEYERDLEANLQSLLDRAKSGTYFAPPVRRAHIPKGKGNETRPLGIPTLEDKILQRAVVMCLEAVYEQDFLPCSYGFRPGRSAHQALDAIWTTAMDVGQVWVLEVDIRRFFDALDKRHLREILRQRVRDGVILRLIGKWLNAGVLERGSLSFPETGTPQGGVISPLLANVYLHEVLDLWIRDRVAPRLMGPVHLVRYADDFVLLFRAEADARRVFAALPKRFAEYGLELHPSKTRLVEFRQPPYRRRTAPHVSFDFLGFTHYWGRSRKGGWVVQRKTAGDRLTRSLDRIRSWCREHRHDPMRSQHRTLSAKVRGHYAYFGIRGNARCLKAYHDEVRRIWKKWLGRRCWKGKLFWQRFERLIARFPLPPPRLPRRHALP